MAERPAEPREVPDQNYIELPPTRRELKTIQRRRDSFTPLIWSTNSVTTHPRASAYARNSRAWFSGSCSVVLVRQYSAALMTGPFEGDDRAAAVAPPLPWAARTELELDESRIVLSRTVVFGL